MIAGWFTRWISSFAKAGFGFGCSGITVLPDRYGDGITVSSEDLNIMTTREEMALAFAVAGYEVTLARIMASDQPPLQELESLQHELVHASVRTADLLISELAKGQPPIKPQVNLKDREACG